MPLAQTLTLFFFCSWDTSPTCSPHVEIRGWWKLYERFDKFSTCHPRQDGVAGWCRRAADRRAIYDIVPRHGKRIFVSKGLHELGNLCGIRRGVVKAPRIVGRAAYSDLAKHGVRSGDIKGRRVRGERDHPPVSVCGSLRRRPRRAERWESHSGRSLGYLVAYSYHLRVAPDSY